MALYKKGSNSCKEKRIIEKFGHALKQEMIVVNMRLRAAAFITLVSACALAPSAQADFQVTGAIRGRECSGLLVFVTCKDVNIDAITTPTSAGDEHFRLEKSSSQITEYDAATQMCFVRIQAGTTSLYGGILVSQFLERKTNGEYGVVNPSLLTFPCVPD